jgi:hypothetical protein
MAWSFGVHQRLTPSSRWRSAFTRYLIADSVVDQRTAAACRVGFRQLRTCRGAGPGPRCLGPPLHCRFAPAPWRRGAGRFDRAGVPEWCPIYGSKRRRKGGDRADIAQPVRASPGRAIFRSRRVSCSKDRSRNSRRGGGGANVSPVSCDFGFFRAHNARGEVWGQSRERQALRAPSWSPGQTAVDGAVGPSIGL